jgi:hypothetical protein
LEALQVWAWYEGFPEFQKIPQTLFVGNILQLFKKYILKAREDIRWNSWNSGSAIQITLRNWPPPNYGV